jgi:hypothetical protein
MKPIYQNTYDFTLSRFLKILSALMYRLARSLMIPPYKKEEGIRN